MEVQMDYGQLGQEFSQLLIQVTSELMAPTQSPKNLSEMERKLRAQLLEVGQFILTAWLSTLEERYPTDTKPCPHCEGEAEYKFKRTGTLQTMFGEIKYERHYYLCSTCHQGFYPLDRQLGLRPGEISAELERLSGMVGVQVPFEQGSDLFEALTLISLSDQSLAKATQAIGAEVAHQEAEWKAQSRDEPWLQEQQRLAERPKRLYGAIDAAKVHIRGKKEHPWRDLKVGCWFTTAEQPPQQPDEEWDIKATDISYYCDIQTAQKFGELVWATGCQQRAQLAEELIFLGDGARWIWDLVTEHYPEAIQIVDWFHATEYIAPVAKAVFGNTEQGQQWIDQVRTNLWEGELEKVIAAFDRYTEHPSAQELAGKAVTYFTNNRHRMDYLTYREKGYQIGSGTVESGCKQIVSQRLKVAGAIWNKDNAVKTAKARAALLSDQWDAITSRREFLALPLAV
jgi:hypothetical protein